MKKLLLIRHAKSDWDHAGLSDHDRPLNDRGQRDCPRMVEALRQRGIAPDAVLSSSAVRARTTAEAIVRGLGGTPESIHLVPELYLAAPNTILLQIQRLDESAETAFIFGHNPGMHEVVNSLDKAGGVEDFPTLAVACFEFDLDHWGEVEWDTGLLMELIIPRSLP